MAKSKQGRVRARPTASKPAPRVSEAERTVASIARMLGWMNVPPRETLEDDIRALLARARRKDDDEYVRRPSSGDWGDNVA